MSQDSIRDTSGQFEEAYGYTPAGAVSAPGRVNMLGAHVDYSDGFVLPVPIDRAVTIAGAPRDDRTVHLRSADFPDEIVFTLDDIQTVANWGDYPKGIVQAHVARGDRVGGFDAFFTSTVPIGGGVSSSAAIDVATSALIQTLFDFHVPGPDVAAMAMRSDNDFVGIRCGIMDQFVSAMGRAKHLLFLDCRSLAYEYVPIDLDTYRIVVLQSGVKRGLLDSEFNSRRAQCEHGAEVIRRRHPEVRALRDVTPEMLAESAGDLTEECLKRCRHAVEEIQRVVDGAEALRNEDMETFAQLMYASHASSRYLYEVTIPELDALIDASQTAPGSMGGRVTGAGFGGCTVHLVEAEALDAFLAHVRSAFADRFGRQPDAMVCQSADGAFVGATEALQ